MILGYFFGEKLLGLSENKSIITSFLSLALAFGVLYLYDKVRAKRKPNSEIEIISIEKEDTSNMVDSCENKNA
jgi:sigma-E factor negative regulatory protein RseC